MKEVEVHLVDDEDETLTACTGERYTPPAPSTPGQAVRFHLCEACQKLAGIRSTV